MKPSSPHLVGAIVGLRREAVGHYPLLDVRQERLHVRMVEAEDGRAVERHPVDELGEGALQPLEGAVVLMCSGRCWVTMAMAGTA